MDAQHFRKIVVEIESIVSKYVSNEVEAMRTHGGDRIANELLASVACLFAARATGTLHTWTGEPIDSIRTRIFECYDADVKETVTRLLNKFSQEVR